MPKVQHQAPPCPPGLHAACADRSQARRAGPLRSSACARAREGGSAREGRSWSVVQEGLKTHRARCCREQAAGVAGTMSTSSSMKLKSGPRTGEATSGTSFVISAASAHTSSTTLRGAALLTTPLAAPLLLSQEYSVPNCYHSRGPRLSASAQHSDTGGVHIGGCEVIPHAAAPCAAGAPEDRDLSNF